VSSKYIIFPWRNIKRGLNKKIKWADQILPEVYGTTLNEEDNNIWMMDTKW
jgi:hypothetical protein